MKLNIEKNTLISVEQEADERELIVPDGIKTIADEGLAHLPLIEKIVLPDSVRMIGRHALFGNVNLRELTLPITASLKDWSLLIRYSENVPLEKLTLTVPQGKADVGITKAFAKQLTGCISSRHVIFCPGLKQIPSETFSRFFPDTQTLEFGMGLKEIGADNFKGAKGMTRVIFPETLEFIGDRAFSNCANLHEVTLPERCEVGADAFKGCGEMRDEKKLSFPDFSILRQLEPEQPIETLTLSGVELKVQGDRLLSTTAEDSVREIAVPDGIRIIEEKGLAHLPHVKKITLPGSVEKILDYAFAGDASLSDLTFPATAKVAAKALDDNIFCTREGKTGGSSRSLKCVTLTLPNCKRLKALNNGPQYALISLCIDRLVFSPGIETIANKGVPDFCTHAKTIVFGEGLRKIGEDNFHLSNDIREIYFPSTLESIGNRSFCFLHLLREVHLPKDCKLGSRVFGNCPPRLKIIRE